MNESLIFFSIFKILFGDIKKRCGDNRKPHIQEFEGALRKVLADRNIEHSQIGNCTVLDPVSQYYQISNIGTISSRTPKKLVVDDNYTVEDIEFVLEQLSRINEEPLNVPDMKDTSIAHIANCIEVQIINDEKQCALCQDVFKSNEKLVEGFTSDEYSTLACKDTFTICKVTDKFFKLDILKSKIDYSLLETTIISQLNMKNLYGASDFTKHGHEKEVLIKKIVSIYVMHVGKTIGKSIGPLKTYQKAMKNRKADRLVNINYN